MNKVGSIAKWLGIAVYAVCASLIVIFLMPVGGWKALNVLTGSMRPAIQPGDLVLVHRVPSRDIHPGDIVTYTSIANSKLTITHRVVSKEVVGGAPMITVKGDANDRADPAFPTGRIVGRVAMIVPAAGRWLGLLHSPFVLLALVVIPGVLLIWAEVRNLIRILAVKPAGVDDSKLNEPPDDMPKSGPPSDGGRGTLRGSQHRGRGRGLDSMGPRLMVVLLGVVLMTMGSTYAGSVNTVKLTQNTLTVVNKSRAALLREAHRVFEQAIHVAGLQLRIDIRVCVANSRVAPVAVFDARAVGYDRGVEKAQTTFAAKVLNPAVMVEGDEAYNRVFEEADGDEVASVDSAQGQLMGSLEREVSPDIKKSRLSQCLGAAHDKYRISIKAARDQLLANIRAILHR